MSHEIEIAVAHAPPRRADLRLFAGEGLRFVITDRLADAEIIATLGGTAIATPLVQITGADQIAVDRAALAALPAGQRYLYDIWLRDGADTRLVQFGTLTQEASAAPL